MNKNTLIAIGLLIAVAVVLGIAATVIDAKRKSEQAITNGSSGTTVPTDDGFKGASIVARQYYREGVHTLAGEMTAPTPCHEVETNVLIRESFPEQVSIEFSLVPTSAEVCAQVIASIPFEVSFTASPEALITATVNGEAAALDLVRGAGGTF